MRFDHNEEFSIDWGAIDRAHRRQRRPLSSKIMPLILWTISMAMLIWLASPYQPITQYILAQDEAVDLRQALNDNQAFPPDGTYVGAKSWRWVTRVPSGCAPAPHRNHPWGLHPDHRRRLP